MSNLRIVPRNWHDEATVSTQYSPVAGFAASNTQNTIRSRVWKTLDGTDQYYLGTFDDGFARTVSFFSMFYHRCHGGSVRLQLYSDAAWTTQVLDTGALAIINVVPTDGWDWGIDPYGAGTLDPYLTDAPFWVYVTPTSCLSYKISFTGNVSTYGAAYWQVQRFFVGYHREFTTNPSYGAMLGFVDMTDKNRSRSGSSRRNLGERWRSATLTLDSLVEAERAGLLDFLKRVGTGRDFVYAMYCDEASRRERDNIGNVTFASMNEIGRQVSRLTSKFQLEEV